MDGEKTDDKPQGEVSNEEKAARLAELELLNTHLKQLLKRRNAELKEYELLQMRKTAMDEFTLLSSGKQKQTSYKRNLAAILNMETKIRRRCLFHLRFRTDAISAEMEALRHELGIRDPSDKTEGPDDSEAA